MKQKLIVEILATMQVILFMYTALNKLLNYQRFQWQLSKSPYLTEIQGVLVWSVPTMEIVVALLLVIRPLRLLGFYVSFFMMLLFTGYVYIMLHYSYYVPCACGGVLASMSWNQHFIFNSVFSVLALAGIVLQPSGRHNISDELHKPALP